jgi:hypothetical protein
MYYDGYFVNCCPNKHAQRLEIVSLLFISLHALLNLIDEVKMVCYIQGCLGDGNIH